MPGVRPDHKVDMAAVGRLSALTIVLATAACAAPHDAFAPPPGAAAAHRETVQRTSAPPLHVLTADYLGDPWGTHAITWAAAAPVLNWAETNATDANAIAAAGIKTMVYVDPNRTQAGGPMFVPHESDYAHDCTGARVTDTYNKTVTQYVMNPASPSMQRLYRTYVRGLLRLAHFDAQFEDDAGALSAFVPYTPFSAMPCGYSDAAWLAQQIQLDDTVELPSFLNGLDGLHRHQPSLLIQELSASTAIGATYEQCYSSNSQPEQNGWLWDAIENTELQVAARGKMFQCMATYSGDAASSVRERLYAYASFLLTYDPATSIYRTLFATPTGLHVMPEAFFVPMEPKRPAPDTIGRLHQRGGTYARTYGACYLAGIDAGPCAVVVNGGKQPHPFPFSGYQRTLVLSGEGILDGGKALIQATAPPATLSAGGAAIAFP